MRLALAFILLVPASAAAQAPIIITPASTLNFTPASDYASTFLDGQPVVNAVKVVYCLSAAPTNCLPTVTISPKPPIGTAGEVAIANIINSIQPNAAYTAKVIASGPGGDSAPSNTTLPFGNAVLTAPSPPGNAKIVK